MTHSPQSQKPQAQKSTQSPRERRVSATMTRMLIMALLVAGTGTVVGLLKNQYPSSFLNGVLAGMLGFLPLAMGWFVYRAYRQMDEYGQRVQERAAASAFLLSMMAAMVGYVIAQAASVSIPLWTLYVFGMVAYGAGVLLQNRGDRNLGDWKSGDR
jgi:hypothetical protein